MKIDFIEECEKLITQKEEGGMNIEEVGKVIIQMESGMDITKGSTEDVIFGYAIDLEIPRDMSVGAGINIGDKWTQEGADQHKEKLWKEFVEFVKKSKS